MKQPEFAKAMGRPVEPDATSGVGSADVSATGPSDPSAAPAAPKPAEVPSNVKFTEKFQLAGGKNIEIELITGASNTWTYVAIDLVNDKTGGVVSFDKNLEEYSGITDGEVWSEGSSLGTQVLGPMEAGEYVMRVETLHGGTSDASLQITVRQDVFRIRYWLFAALALGFPFGIIALHAYAFRKKRWENSQLTRWSENESSASHAWGDDDDD